MSDLYLLTAQLVADALTSPEPLKLPALPSHQAAPAESIREQAVDTQSPSPVVVPNVASAPRFSAGPSPTNPGVASPAALSISGAKSQKPTGLLNRSVSPVLEMASAVHELSANNELSGNELSQRDRDRALMASIRQRVATAANPPTPSVSRLQSGFQSPLLQTIPAFSGPRPESGSQLYHQRIAALRSGRLYTRLSPDSFQPQWQNASDHPTYDQWRTLLNREAQAMADGQGQNRLTVILGDSISLWLPPDWLPRDRFWLNQGISGDTTAGILQRLSAIDQTHPDTIHLMAGINDLKNGASDATVLNNLQTIVRQLRQTHPQARVVVHSILPTRLSNLPSDRISALNQQIAAMSQQEGGFFLDLQPNFADRQGDLRYELTTDGLHLNPSGYRLWQVAMLSV
ncbi:MAG: GDSL-type esterase/lipase family protein [Cyanobacteria bacterium P01_A01_bin.123]